MQCKNCASEFATNYCPGCGASAQVKRINRNFILHEIQHGVFHIDRGFLFTLKQLAAKPGTAVRAYLEGSRSRYYKPLGFLAINSLLYLAVKYLIGFKDIETTQPLGSNTSKILTWAQEHYQYSNLFEILFSGFALSLFFRKRGYNYFEYLVLLCYLNGFGMFFLTLAMLAAGITGYQWVYYAGLYAMVFYSTWGIGQFFAGRKWTVYLKAFLAYNVGFILFFVALFAIGIALDALNVKL